MSDPRSAPELSVRADSLGLLPPAAPSEAVESDAISDLTPVVGANLRRLRVKRGLSLERLARVSGVSRAMLSQIELGQSTPTINVLWKVARALDVSFSALIGEGEKKSTVVLLPRSRAKLLSSYDGAFCSRALSPVDSEPHKVEFYELRLAPHRFERADAHAPGTTENLVVTAGTLEMHVGSERLLVRQGDAVFFTADVPHEYHNPGDVEAVMYLVMTYV